MNKNEKMDHTNHYTTMMDNITQDDFDSFSSLHLKSLFNDDSSGSEDFASIPHKLVNNEDKKQRDEMCELTSTSYEKDINVSESNSRELTDTELADGKIGSMPTSSLSTALPIMQTSPKSSLHTCFKHCLLCKKDFCVLDIPLHIGWIRSIDKQNEFLKIEPSLRIDSCLCDFCWKFLEKTYKSNRAQKVNEETFPEMRTRLLECYGRKKRSNNKKCSIHFCSKDYSHKMSVNEYENIKKMLSTFESCRLVFVEPIKQTSDFLRFPFRLCEDHYAMIMVMSSCQICSFKLIEPFNTADWSMYETWNFVLFRNNLPLILQRGMFICMTCRNHICKSNPGFPTNDLPHLRKNIIINKAIRLKLYGKLLHNLFDLHQESTHVTPPIVVPKIKENKECVYSTKVKFTDPLITVTYHYEVDFDENDTESITNIALLNVGEQNLVTPKLEPQDEGLDLIKLEEEHFETFMTNKHTDQFYNLNTDSTPNTSGIEMTNSLNENVFDDIPENILSEQNYPSNFTDINVSNDFFDLFSYAATNHVPRHDNNKDWLQLHSDHRLKLHDIKISKQEAINQYPVNNVEIAINEPEIIDSCHVVSGHSEIKNNQSKFNSDNIYNVYDKSSTDLKELNQCSYEINTIHETVNLNETDNSMYSCSAAVELPNVLVNPVSIRRKPNNVKCDTISNKIVKKPRLNENYSSYENNSTDNNTNESYGNKNIAHLSINSPSILNTISNCKNKHVLNSDFIGVQDLPSDVDEESLKLQSSYLLKGIESNTNVPSISIENVFSLDPSYARPPQFKHLFKKVPYSYNKKKYSRKGLKNVLLDNDVYDSESLPETITLSDSEIKVSNSNILSDSEWFSETDCEDILPEIEEDDLVILKDGIDIGSIDIKLKDLDNEIRSDTEIRSDYLEELQYFISRSNSEEVFNDTKLSTFKVVDIRSGREVLLNDTKYFKTKSQENGNKTYWCGYKDKIKPSGNKGSTCVVLYDNFEESINKNLTTHKVYVIKGLDYKILLDDETVKVVVESKNINKPSKLFFNLRIEPSSNKTSTCIVLMDYYEMGNYSKKLATIKTVSKFTNSGNKVLLNGLNVFGIVMNIGMNVIRYNVSFIEIGSNGDDKKYYYFSKLNNKDNNKKNVENDSSDNQEIYYKKVSDIIAMPKDKIDVYDPRGDNEADRRNQEYFKNIYRMLHGFFENSNEALRTFYSKLGNEEDILLYLMENYRMVYNKELVVSETADEFSKNYLKEHINILNNCFGDPKDSINDSKPFIHPSSHLHQYSKRLSADVIPLPIQDMTTSSSLTKSNSIASKVQTQVSKRTTPIRRPMLFPVAIKKKNIW